jgi:hypothetical protein
LENRICRLENGFVLLTYDHVRSPDGICQLPDDLVLPPFDH